MKISVYQKSSKCTKEKAIGYDKPKSFLLTYHFSYSLQEVEPSVLHEICIVLGDYRVNVGKCIHEGSMDKHIIFHCMIPVSD